MKDSKFKAWDSQANCMLGGGGMQVNATTGELDHLPSVVVLQYIGRKDKNGKEIYEGELLEYPVTSYPLEVVWDDFSCAFMLRDVKGDLMDMPVKEAMAKYGLSIGNIYENPELLEGA